MQLVHRGTALENNNKKSLAHFTLWTLKYKQTATTGEKTVSQTHFLNLRASLKTKKKPQTQHNLTSWFKEQHFKRI